MAFLYQGAQFMVVAMQSLPLIKAILSNLLN